MNVRVGDKVRVNCGHWAIGLLVHVENIFLPKNSIRIQFGLSSMLMKIL